MKELEQSIKPGSHPAGPPIMGAKRGTCGIRCCGDHPVECREQTVVEQFVKGTT
jgi:hypothetical protein